MIAKFLLGAAIGVFAGVATHTGWHDAALSVFIGSFVTISVWFIHRIDRALNFIFGVFDD
ncbi:hypothetical protein E6R60_26800 [Streptomyces sp. A0642]|uniref:hypothetical protein n=1 Tax=Streptomyces sp. A0642 TaxID=2563100 RepID=UPI0010A21352|nr:hypothetical protein [Streptomyces sp. A0642]THA72540.1 hypothetical protein E6R60_26800 [Streptomyces sp. A0642]